MKQVKTPKNPPDGKMAFRRVTLKGTDKYWFIDAKTDQEAREIMAKRQRRKVELYGN